MYIRKNLYKVINYLGKLSMGVDFLTQKEFHKELKMLF